MSTETSTQKTTPTQLETALAILQQGEYDIAIFERWWKKHGSKQDIHTEQQFAITPDKWSIKLKLISTICKLLPFVSIPAKIKIALVLIEPLEKLARGSREYQARTKLRAAQKNGLIVIAIAGSYGKTSSKHWITHLLSNQVNVLSTEKSINTPLGIADTILTKLKPEHQIFIVEFGEYYAGDIKQLADFVQPNLGVLTPIGHQHLERMHTIETIAQTIGELITFFEQKGSNTVDVVVSAIENAQYYQGKVSYVGNPDSDMNNPLIPQTNSPDSVSAKKTTQKSTWHFDNVTVSPAGTHMSLKKNSEEFSQVFTPLYGESQCSNALFGFWLGEKLQQAGLTISLETMAKTMATMPYISQRHEPHFAANNVLILDNSYNTNPDSFPQSLTLLHELKPTRSFVITLGFVELGDASTEIHQKLGALLAEKVEYLGIIDSDQASIIKESFIKSGGTESHVIIAPTPETCMQALQPFVIPGSIILFEGGYREVLI